MFEKGDVIIYGSSGVCKIMDVGQILVNNSLSAKPYYTLKPYFSNSKETIYIPVDTNMYMRNVIKPNEVEQFIEQIPKMQANVNKNRDKKIMYDYYNKIIQTHDCNAILHLIKSVYIENVEAASQNKKLSQVDQNFLKRAEELLYGEFAAVMNISYEKTKSNVESRFMLSNTPN